MRSAGTAIIVTQTARREAPGLRLQTSQAHTKSLKWDNDFRLCFPLKIFRITFTSNPAVTQALFRSSSKAHLVPVHEGYTFRLGLRWISKLKFLRLGKPKVQPDIENTSKQHS
jgi:hypothetical protein